MCIYISGHLPYIIEGGGDDRVHFDCGCERLQRVRTFARRDAERPQRHAQRDSIQRHHAGTCFECVYVRCAVFLVCCCVSLCMLFSKGFIGESYGSLSRRG